MRVKYAKALRLREIRDGTLGSRIKQLRYERHWTQKHLASYMGFDQGHIAEHETNAVEPRWDNILAYAKAFEMTLSELFEGVS